jgi:hypothetical protein
MNPLARAVAVAVLSLGAAACGRSYSVPIAPGFVHVGRDEPPYDWRAVAPDGVVVALRVLHVDADADLAFWTHAVSLRMRELERYALLTMFDVRSRDGVPGTEIVFGHDESGKPFVYRVRLFVIGSKLTLLEAGGIKDQMDRYRASVDWMLGNVCVL